MSLESEVRRGELARSILENSVYAETWAALEAEIIRQWRESRNAEDREQLHQLLLMHGKAKAAMETVLRTGDVARAELQRKLTRAEQIIGAVQQRA